MRAPGRFAFDSRRGPWFDASLEGQKIALQMSDRCAGLGVRVSVFDCFRATVKLRARQQEFRLRFEIPHAGYPDGDGHASWPLLGLRFRRLQGELYTDEMDSPLSVTALEHAVYFGQTWNAELRWIAKPELFWAGLDWGTRLGVSEQELIRNAHQQAKLDAGQMDWNRWLTFLLSDGCAHRDRASVEAAAQAGPIFAAGAPV